QFTGWHTAQGTRFRAVHTRSDTGIVDRDPWRSRGKLGRPPARGGGKQGVICTLVTSGIPQPGSQARPGGGAGVKAAPGPLGAWPARTVAGSGEHQISHGLCVEENKRHMHHYNFPTFSVGETGPIRGPGRREIGHGALGERALLQVIPDETVFPYTIRVVSEVL